MRVALFTDTLGDVNGVSRFLNDIADHALERDLPLHILTSTRFAVRPIPTLHNTLPRAAIRLPGYPDLQIVLPPVRRLLQQVQAIHPDVIHVSTPGPVGFAGRLIARRLGIPLAGVYHTDLPSYVEHLFDDEALTHLAGGAMRQFYRPFRMVFSRSHEYSESLARLGIHASRRVALRPGFNTARFHPRYRDERCWAECGIRASSLKVLYVGRVSVEKNLPLLTEIWKRVRALAPGLDASLVVIGDGPYRASMESTLAGSNAHFLGFRHGEELSRLYASSDVFVFPSVTDTLGQVVLESQASGLPTLVTNVGGPKEVVIHDKTGYIISAREPAAWAECIARLLRDAARRSEMGNEAHRHASQFSIERSFYHFWQLHEQIHERSLVPSAEIPSGFIESKPPTPEMPAPSRDPELDSVPA